MVPAGRLPHAVAPVAVNDLSALYAPPPGSTNPVAWRIRVKTTHLEAVDAVSVPRVPESPRPMDRCLLP